MSTDSSVSAPGEERGECGDRELGWKFDFDIE